LLLKDGRLADYGTLAELLERSDETRQLCGNPSSDTSNREKFMFVVLFEVQPKAEEWETYLDLARLLRPEVEQIDGFIDNERYTSRKTDGRLLSLSTWRDEKALIRWRTLAVHHDMQQKGRSQVFAEYHLRVGEVTADTSPPRGLHLDQQRFDTTTVGDAQVVSIVEIPPDTALPSSMPPASDGAEGLVDLEQYHGITTPGKALRLASWRDEASLAAEQARRPLPAWVPSDQTTRLRVVRIIRDYGMRDRREAPQYYPPVEPTRSAAAGT
jgi:heme-degrading monooxygenase HmoA